MSAAPAMLTQAGALLRSGKPAEAERLLRALVADQPGSVPAWRLLGQALRQSGKVAEACEALRRAAGLPGADATTHGLSGVALLEAGRRDEAVAAFRRATELDPGSFAAWFHLGKALLESFDAPGAVAALERAVALDPDNPDGHSALGAAYIARGQGTRARPHFERALNARPGAPDALCNLANAMRYEGRLDECRSLYERALAQAPAFGPAVSGMADLLRAQGDRDGAYAVLRRAIDAGAEHPYLALALAPLVKGRGPDAAAHAEALLRRVIGAPRATVPQKAGAWFALGQLREDGGDDDGAWEAFRRANEMFPRTYDPAHSERLTAEYERVFTPEAMARLPRASERDPLPVFVVGMSRSGTSLVEQVLSSHPRVHGAGELNDMRDIARALPGRLGVREPFPRCVLSLTAAAADAASRQHRAHLRELGPGKDRVIDKMPQNFFYVGLIALLFPGARVIHCVRDPIDTCLSCYTTALTPAHAYANRLEDLVVYYRHYRRLMDLWERVGAARAPAARDAGTPGVPILHVRYEDMVADQEGVSRRLVEFLGLDWDDACLKFYEAPRAVNTASVDQVRRPIYSSSRGRWKRYEKHLGPLVDGLREFLAES